MSGPAVLTPLAARELRKALRTIAQDNPDAAGRLNDAVELASRRLGANPSLGSTRPYLPPRYRFWPIARFPYLLVYDTTSEPLLILRCLHMARDLPRLLGSLSN